MNAQNLRCIVQVVHACMQEALSAIDRVHSASSYTVAPCGQLQVACGQAAPEPEALLDEEMLNTEILPFVDGIITSQGNASIEPVFAFSASTDPGVFLRMAWLVSDVMHDSWTVSDLTCVAMHMHMHRCAHNFLSHTAHNSMQCLVLQEAAWEVKSCMHKLWSHATLSHASLCCGHAVLKTLQM